MIRVLTDEGDDWEIKLDEEEHTVVELKRLILNKKNRPFLLNLPVENSTKISSYLEMNMAQRGINESDFQGKLIDKKTVFAQFNFSHRCMLYCLSKTNNNLSFPDVALPSLPLQTTSLESVIKLIQQSLNLGELPLTLISKK
jgi:hypothetical protein